MTVNHLRGGFESPLRYVDIIAWVSGIFSVLGAVVSAITLVTVRQLRHVEKKTDEIERDVHK